MWTQDVSQLLQSEIRCDTKLGTKLVGGYDRLV